MISFNVAKFGGTSVATHEAMLRCADIVKQNPQTRLVVISACSGVTNHLIALAKGIYNPKSRQEKIDQIAQIHKNILDKLEDTKQVKADITPIFEKLKTLAQRAAQASTRELTDEIVSSGELISTHLLTQVMREAGLCVKRFDVREIMRTNSLFGCAEPNLAQISQLTEHRIRPLLTEQIIVTQGFIGRDNQGKTTTLGRGGSDYSAALIAEAIGAKSLEIWTDVSGIYSTDPRIAPKAKPISEISFIEASEMANFGAKILHPSTLVPALRQQIPVFVGSSKAPHQGGTWVQQQVKDAPRFRALTLRGNQTMVTLHSTNMYQAYGFLAKVFEILARHKVSVDLITTSEVSVSLTLDQADTSSEAPKLPENAKKELETLCDVTIEHQLCLVALIGNKMNQPGLAKQVFSTLDNLNLRMICYGASAHNLCFLVHESESKDAVKLLHQALFE